jgi:hypothetical protein
LWFETLIERTDGRRKSQRRSGWEKGIDEAAGGGVDVQRDLQPALDSTRVSSASIDSRSSICPVNVVPSSPATAIVRSSSSGSTCSAPIV